MKRKMTTIVLLIAAAVLIAVVVFHERQQVGNEPGMLAEDFTLPMHERDEGSLSDYFGDVIVLNIWASWCKPCQKEMPELMKLQEDYGDEGLKVLTVNAHFTERTVEDAPKFIEEMGITLPVFFDEDGVVWDRYQLIGLPTTYIIDRKGRIKHKIPGEVNYEGLKPLVEPLL